MQYPLPVAAPSYIPLPKLWQPLLQRYITVLQRYTESHKVILFCSTICKFSTHKALKFACVCPPHLPDCTLQLNVQSYRGEVCLVRGVSSTISQLEQVWYESNASVLSAEWNGQTPDRELLSSWSEAPATEGSNCTYSLLNNFGLCTCCLEMHGD
jgi:hypothetical protein